MYQLIVFDVPQVGITDSAASGALLLFFFCKVKQKICKDFTLKKVILLSYFQTKTFSNSWILFEPDLLFQNVPIFSCIQQKGTAIFLPNN